MGVLDLILVTGLAARATRLFVYDDAGWLVRVPMRWFGDLFGRSGKLFVSGLLSCPFCIGFWLSLGSAFSWSAWGDTVLWTAIALGATVSYVVGHLAGRLDETLPD